MVGAGLTGCLTAALLRRNWPVSEHEPTLNLTIWERATYPAGRFGAVLHYNESVSDIGAQVLSVVDPDEEHIHVMDGGHGIGRAALLMAKAEVKEMKDRGLLVEVPDDTLEAKE